MPPTVETPAPPARTTPTPIARPRKTDGPEPLRRKQIPAPVRASIWRRALNFLLVFAGVVLLADALVGERGLVATTRARRQSAELNASVDALRRENARLRDWARRLREDPTTIESIARQELGLIRSDEVLVFLKDVKPVTK
jgi:cell division protein FtsB